MILRPNYHTQSQIDWTRLEVRLTQADTRYKRALRHWQRIRTARVNGDRSRIMAIIDWLYKLRVAWYRRAYRNLLIPRYRP